MKVKELIKELKKFDGENNVVIRTRCVRGKSRMDFDIEKNSLEEHREMCLDGKDNDVEGKFVIINSDIYLGDNLDRDNSYHCSLEGY